MIRWKWLFGGAVALAALFVGTNTVLSQFKIMQIVSEIPEYDPSSVIPNHEWENEEEIKLEGYSRNAMEIGLSYDGQYLLFNDQVKRNKDMHWARRVRDGVYEYKGKVENTISPTVDGTPCFDCEGKLYFTSLKNLRGSSKTMYVADFQDGVATNITPIEGDIYKESPDFPKQIWISLDPSPSSDGSLLFYSEGLFHSPAPFPYPFNIRGAKKVGGKFVKMDDRILVNVNTDSLEYAAAVSSDGLELFFSRISRKGKHPAFVGVYVAKRSAPDEPFGKPEKIMAITGDVEAPVLSPDETQLYYHRKAGGVFKVFRVTKKKR